MSAAGYRWRWAGLLAVLAASLMNLLDANVVNIAAPTIRNDLGGSYGGGAIPARIRVLHPAERHRVDDEPHS